MTAYVKPRFSLPGQQNGSRDAMVIQQIRVTVWTADADHADSRSRLYLGAAGREFALHIDENDLARGARTTFVLGEQANVDDPDGNDPRTPPFAWRSGEHPVYLRLETDGEEPAWLLEWARVEFDLDSGRTIAYEQPALSGVREDRRLWLDGTAGKIVYLTRALESHPPASDPSPTPS